MQNKQGEIEAGRSEGRRTLDDRRDDVRKAGQRLVQISLAADPDQDSGANTVAATGRFPALVPFAENLCERMQARPAGK